MKTIRSNKTKVTLFLTLGLILTTSCKKETITPTGNPNIIYTSINATFGKTQMLANQSKEIDMNNDGTIDFTIRTNRIENITDSLLDIDFISEQFQNSTSNGYAAAVNYRVLAPGNIIAYGADINVDNSITSWYDGGGIFYREKTAGAFTGTKYSFFDGIGDQYIVTRVKVGTEMHYGWIRVNISALGESIQIKDMAFHKIVDATIKTGEK